MPSRYYGAARQTGLSLRLRLRLRKIMLSEFKQCGQTRPVRLQPLQPQHFSPKRLFKLAKSQLKQGLWQQAVDVCEGIVEL